MNFDLGFTTYNIVLFTQAPRIYTMKLHDLTKSYIIHLGFTNFT